MRNGNDILCVIYFYLLVVFCIIKCWIIFGLSIECSVSGVDNKVFIVVCYFFVCFLLCEF